MKEYFMEVLQLNSLFCRWTFFGETKFYNNLKLNVPNTYWEDLCSMNNFQQTRVEH